MTKNRLSKRAATLQPSMSLAISAKAEELRRNGVDVLSLSVGEPDFDTPSLIKEAGIRAIQEGKTKYTRAQGTVELREAIARRIKKDTGVDYPIEQITVANGAKHSIMNALLALLDPGDEAIVLSPYWVSYPEMIRLCEATPVIIHTKEEKDFKVDRPTLEEHASDKTKVLILNAPSNPTGSDYTKEELQAITDWAVEQNVFIVSDEIYSKLLYEGTHYSPVSFGREVNNLTILINGVSKSYAMTGWRIGYAAGPADIIKAMNGLQSQMTSNPNSIAQFAGTAAFDADDALFLPMVQAFRERRDYCVARVNQIPGMHCNTPDGAFYLFVNVTGIYAQNDTVRDSLRLAAYLLDEAQVAVIPGIGFGQDAYIRLSFAAGMETLEEALNRIETAVVKLLNR